MHLSTWAMSRPTHLAVECRTTTEEETRVSVAFVGSWMLYPAVYGLGSFILGWVIAAFGQE